MSDSEDDYMSDTFLAKCGDTRPGLVPDKIAKQYKREVKIKELNIINKIKPLKVLEAEKRSEGLSQVLDEKNKGFSLLQKMGYISGMGLGKEGSGRSEPVPINVRTGRGGLGEDTERKRKQQEALQMRHAMIQKKKKREATFQKDFRVEKSKLRSEKQQEADLYKSQRVCEQLDEDKGIVEPEELYYWTPVKMRILLEKLGKDENSEEESDEYEENPAPPHMSQSFLPNSHDDLDDLDVNEQLDDGMDEKELPPTGEQLQTLTNYLRANYLYCVWCGTRFNDEEDLAENCPGDTSAVHDS